jgi:hypothetical protein
MDGKFNMRICVDSVGCGEFEFTDSPCLHMFLLVFKVKFNTFFYYISLHSVSTSISTSTLKLLIIFVSMSISISTPINHPLFTIRVLYVYPKLTPHLQMTFISVTQKYAP